MKEECTYTMVIDVGFLTPWLNLKKTNKDIFIGQPIFYTHDIAFQLQESGQKRELRFQSDICLLLMARK